MILGYSKNYIFLHSRKTAGSSMSVELARHFRESDIMIGAWGDAIRSGVKPNKKCIELAREAMGRKARMADVFSKKLKQPDEFNLLVKKYFRENYGFEAGAHSSAMCVKKFAGDFWKDAFKFCFVRNPWDHAVSDYYWRGCHHKGVTFKEFLALTFDPEAPDPKKVRPPIRSNWSVYTIDGKIAVDFIGRYENLQNDMDSISSVIGVGVDMSRTKAKNSSRSKADIKSHYDDECVDLVNCIYKNEIEQFNYRPPF